MKGFWNGRHPELNNNIPNKRRSNENNEYGQCN